MFDILLCRNYERRRTTKKTLDNLLLKLRILHQTNKCTIPILENSFPNSFWCCFSQLFLVILFIQPTQCMSLKSIYNSTIKLSNKIAACFAMEVFHSIQQIQAKHIYNTDSQQPSHSRQNAILVWASIDYALQKDSSRKQSMNKTHSMCPIINHWDKT